MIARPALDDYDPDDLREDFLNAKFIYDDSEPELIDSAC